jgi:2-methylisocitrate lyase-like PEP mutase family enzyme
MTGRKEPPRQGALSAAAGIAASVPVPVTVDAEAGWSMAPRDLVDRVSYGPRFYRAALAGFAASVEELLA